MGVHQQPALSLPQRLWVIGTSGAGKTTLGRRIADALNIPAIDMDDLYWRPDWASLPTEELHAVVANATAAPSWVISGNYGRYRKRQLARVQLLVWLDLPFPVVFGRVVRRTADRAGRGTLCCNGNRETWRKALLSRDSILLWSLKTFAKRRREARRELANVPHVRLRSAAQAEAWLRSLAERASRSPVS